MASNEPANATQTALIIGASSGIGAALARRLAARGYRVALVARRLDLLTQLRDELNGAAGATSGQPVARAYAHDVCAYDEAPALFERIVAECDPDAPLRLVIYNAGTQAKGTRGGSWTFADERATIETNVLGAMRWLGLAADAFTAAGRGTIVGISSVAGDRGRNGNSAYMASKAALSIYLESLRYRLRARGVRVVTVKPGYVATPLTAGMRLPKALVASVDPVAERIAQACERGTPVLYVPGYWAAIMWIVRHLPGAVMARLPV